MLRAPRPFALTLASALAFAGAAPAVASSYPVAVVDGAAPGRQPVFAAVDAAAFGGASPLPLVDAATANLRLRLNAAHPALAPAAGEPRDAVVRRAFVVSGAHYVVVAPSGGAWELYAKRGDGVVKLHEAAGAPSRGGAAIGEWLTRALGYDGYVVARGDTGVLARLPAGKATARRQALLFPGGRGGKRSGEAAAILELTRVQDGVAVFKVVLGDATGAADGVVLTEP